MLKLAPTDTDGLYRAVTSEHQSHRGAADALEDFPDEAVFTHLRDSAQRHISILCATLHSGGANAPVLAPVPTTRYENLSEALIAAADREEQTAAIYNDLIRQTRVAEFKQVLVPLWQSVQHLHLTAINDRLAREHGDV